MTAMRMFWKHHLATLAPIKSTSTRKMDLVLRIVGQHHTLDGPATFTEDFNDFREVDGVKLPYTVHQESPNSTFTIKFTEIRHNEAIEDALFSNTRWRIR